MAISETKLDGLNVFKKGKVRDVYELNGGLLIVATDRISAFDVVLPNPIPYKGEILNQLSLFWFDYFKDTVRNHLISSDPAEYPGIPDQYRELLRYRSAYVRRARSFPVECIVRGYISGSGWKEYRKTGTVCGITLEKGLKESDKLAEPVFTPSTKAEIGEHDMNISYEKTVDLVGSETAAKLRDFSLSIYMKARDYALTKGIIIADTKFEFGVVDGEVILIDEVLTPDSSRFWPLESYRPGESQVSLDKQYIRDYLVAVDWESKASIPELPADVIANTFRKYRQAYEVLTGKKFRIQEL